MSTLLDDNVINVYRSSSGKRHIEGWYGQTLCGSWIDRANDWHWTDLTSVRQLGRIAQQGTRSRIYCNRCLNNYKDVDING